MMLRARREAEEEPQMPDEQLHANDQLQRDEMLALEAIYGDNISIFGEKFGLRYFQDPEKLGASSGGKVDKVTDLRNELVSIREALRDAVPCPHCCTAISRVSGGNHMRCRNCGTGFCYDCGKPLDNHRSEKQCRFDKEHKSVKQAGVVKQIQRHVTSQQFSSYPCPNCHQQNPKVGNNNHIFCWTCQVHYCALCRKVVRKSSEHYGPRGCKQHTVDTRDPAHERRMTKR